MAEIFPFLSLLPETSFAETQLLKGDFKKRLKEDQDVDGSIVSGAKLEQAPAPDGSLPWLLLKAVPQSRKGRLAQITYVQRLHTKGGAAPATADATKKPSCWKFLIRPNIYLPI